MQSNAGCLKEIDMQLDQTKGNKKPILLLKKVKMCKNCVKNSLSVAFSTMLIFFQWCWTMWLE